MGLKPGNGDSWYQTVSMVETTAEPVAATVKVRDKTLEWAFGTQWVTGTRSGQAAVEVTDSPMVFVGYGTVAPEENWNDYAGLDVKGKTVVMLVNDPGFHVDDPALFGGKRMTYYGRWTYKFEEAARQGAAAALIIHDTDGAGYGWSVVENGWTGAQYDLPAAEDPEPRLPLQGWITGESAQDLFAQSGLSLEALRRAASKPGFRSVPLPATLSVALKSTIKASESGTCSRSCPARSVPTSRGLHGPLGPWAPRPLPMAACRSSTGRSTTPGRGRHPRDRGRLRAAGTPKRSVLFAAVTLEESGLLGSKYYVAHPTFPMRNIAGVINIDAMTIVGAPATSWSPATVRRS